MLLMIMCGVTPSFKAKSDAHYMCVQDQVSTHMVRITAIQTNQCHDKSHYYKNILSYYIKTNHELSR
jgi:hypothetical protein